MSGETFEPLEPASPRAARPEQSKTESNGRLRVELTGVTIEAQAPVGTFLAASVDMVPLAELVQLVVRHKRTGRLDLKTGEGTRSLYFEGGAYTGAISNFTADRLGEVLWRNNHISLDQLVIAGELVKEGKMLGRALVELGFLDGSILRQCLIEQAISTFQAACTEEHGLIFFVKDAYHRAPLRFGISTSELVDQALAATVEHREVLQRLGRLDRPFLPQRGGARYRPPGSDDMGFETAADTSALDEAEQAMVQLVMSAKGGERTGTELIGGSGLGLIVGARTLLRLVDKGRILPKALPADDETRLRRLCQAVSLTMDALDEAGFGVAEQVREMVENPPAHLEEALSGLTLREPLDPPSLMAQAQFLPGGLKEMNAALQAVLDEAIQQAEDMLSEDLTTHIRRRVKAILPPE